MHLIKESIDVNVVSAIAEFGLRFEGGDKRLVFENLIQQWGTSNYLRSALEENLVGESDEKIKYYL